MGISERQMDFVFCLNKKPILLELLIEHTGKTAQKISEAVDGRIQC
jgi:hypothetical protein